jgi:hypothetical protein
MSGQSNAFTQNTISLISTLGHRNTTKGENWTCSIQAYDGIDYESDQNNATTLMIRNKAPNVTVRVYPTNPTTEDDLLGFCNSSDADNDSVMYYYIWYKDNSINITGITSYTQPTVELNVYNISNEQTSVGNNWTLSCLASDGTSNSTWQNSSLIVVLNSAPNTTRIILNSTYGTNYTDEDLKCYANITDVDLDDVYANYTWYNNSIAFMSGQSTAFTQNTISLISTLGNRNTTKGENWTCSIQAYDGNNYESDQNNATLTIINKAPNTTSVIISPTSPATDDNLEGFCNSTDADTDNVIFYYRWYKNNILNASGNTSYNEQGIQINVNNLSSENTNSGENWTLSCLASDGTANSTWQNTTKTIVNSGPRISAFNMTDDSETEGYQINPIVDSIKTFYAWFNVSDPDGLTDINSTWLKIMDAGGSEESPNYVNYSLVQVSCSAATCLYNGSLSIWYYATAGTWNISFYANDTSGTQARNSTTFTVTALVGFSLQNSPVDFGSLAPNKVDQNATSPLIILNKGNQPFAMNISAAGNLTGALNSSYSIPIQNIGYSNSSSFVSVSNLTTSKSTFMNNLAVNNTFNLYFRITTPQIKAQHYSSNITFETS